MPDLDQRILTGPDRQLGDRPPALLVDLLDALRVNTAIRDQPLERELADLAAHRIEAGEQDGLWRVVDDQVDAGDRFERPDVPALRGR